MEKAIQAAKREAMTLGANYAINQSEYWIEQMRVVVRALVMLDIADNDTACEIVESAFWGEYDRICNLVNLWNTHPFELEYIADKQVGVI